MKKRKLMALALSGVMVCSLAACGGKDSGGRTENARSGTSTDREDRYRREDRQRGAG